MRTLLLRTVFLAAVFAVIGCSAIAAEDYPSHPITVIAPFPPGGPSDALARILSGP
jgi:tripartite-type tricarboxylate transporter receptor subunit TctC